jgi:glucose-6-phosphate dehydrogenase assembly protein OpcA
MRMAVALDDLANVAPRKTTRSCATSDLETALRERVVVYRQPLAGTSWYR